MNHNNQRPAANSVHSLRSKSTQPRCNPLRKRRRVSSCSSCFPLDVLGSILVLWIHAQRLNGLLARCNILKSSTRDDGPTDKIETAKIWKTCVSEGLPICDRPHRKECHPEAKSAGLLPPSACGGSWKESRKQLIGPQRWTVRLSVLHHHQHPTANELSCVGRTSVVEKIAFLDIISKP